MPFCILASGIVNQWKCTVYSWRFVYYKFSHLHAIKSFGGSRIILPPILNLIPDGDQLVSRSGCFTSVVGTRGTHFIQGCTGPRTSVDTLEEECLSLAGNRSTIPRTYVKPVTSGPVHKIGNVPMPQHWGALMHPLLHWKRNNYYIFWVCVCSFRYSACNAHAPYCHLRPARLYIIFSIFINGTIFYK
jgi:hypothetical protein